MTYQSETTTYEFTAFTEADLLGDSNGSSIGYCDTFTMPASATTCFEVVDNDRFLSGDSRKNENSNDSSFQTATITDEDGNSIGNGGQIYAEKYHVLRGDDGKVYYMIEIEQENGDAPGQGDDYFTFYGSVPPAGTELTVVGGGNVRSDWVDFKCIGAGLKWDLDEDCAYTIEAEDMELWGYVGEQNDEASGDELIRLKRDVGSAKLDFGGTSGAYDITITYMDENDGEGFLDIFVNGELVGTISLNQNNNGNGYSDPTTFSEFTLEGISISQGDEIKLRGRGDGSEFIRVDKIVFEQEKEPELGSLSGRYFCDDDHNGVDNGEDGVAGALVTLTDAAGNVIATTTTDDIGNYSFQGLEAGDYKVSFDPPVDEGIPGPVDTPGVIDSDDFSSGELASFWTLTGPGGSAGVVVDGDEAFLEINVPSGDFDPFPGDGSNDAVRVVQSTEDTDFQVEAKFLSVPGEQFELQGIMVEQDADNWIRFDIRSQEGAHRLFVGYRDDDNGVIVLDLGPIDPADAAVMRVTRDGDTWTYETSADGVIWTPRTSFDFDLEVNAVGPFGGTVGEPDGFTVKVDYFYNSAARIDYDDSTLNLETGKSFVAQNVGDDDRIDSDVNEFGTTDTIVLASGQDITDVDAGIEGPPQGVLGDTVWLDSFANGVLDDFEQRAGGVTVQLLDMNGELLEETQTALDGTYLFQNLEAGDYQVRFVLPDNFVFTSEGVGDDATDSDADPLTGLTQIVTLAEGEQNLTVDAGLLACGLIEGTSASDPTAPAGGMDLLIGCEGDDTMIGFSGDDTINGNGGNDQIDGGFDEDLLNGGAGDDTLVGGNDADTLIGGAGNDLLDGSRGVTPDHGSFDRDVVIYEGNQADYDINQVAFQNVIVTDLVGDDGVDQLLEIEVIRFADGDLIIF